MSEATSEKTPRPGLAVLSVLRNRNFALLWGGQAISQLGDAVFYIALMWLVLELTDSALATGTLMMLTQVPRLLMQLVGGVAVDRYDRRVIMLASDLLRGVAVLVFALLVISGHIRLWHAYVLAIIFGVVTAFFWPAKDAIVPSLVTGEELIPANSLNMATFQLNNVLGPALGGFLIAVPFFGIGGAALLNAFSFLIGALGLWLIRLPPSADREASANSLWTDLKEGFGYLGTQRALLVMVALFAVMNFTAAPIMVLLPVFAKNVLRVGSEGYGLLQASMGVGLLGGSILIGAVGQVKRKGSFVMKWALVDGLLLAAIGLSRNLPMAMLIFALFGVVNGVINVTLMAFLQSIIADEFRGRVFGTLALLSGGLQPISMGLAGALADHWGTATVIMAGGVGVAIAALVGFFNPAVREVD